MLAQLERIVRISRGRREDARQHRREKSEKIGERGRQRSILTRAREREDAKEEPGGDEEKGSMGQRLKSGEIEKR